MLVDENAQPLAHPGAAGRGISFGNSLNNNNNKP